MALEQCGEARKMQQTHIILGNLLDTSAISGRGSGFKGFLHHVNKGRRVKRLI